MGVGIFVGYAAGMPFKFAYISFSIFALGSLAAWIWEKDVEKGITFIFICLAVFFLGMTLIQGERQNLAQHPLTTSLKGKTLSIRGTICAYPKEKIIYHTRWEKGQRKAVKKVKISFPIKIEQIKRKDTWQDMGGKILVNVYEIASLRRLKPATTALNDKFRIGDRIEIKGFLRPLPTVRNPGDFNYGAYLLRKGILGQIYPVRNVNPANTPHTSLVRGTQDEILNGVSILSRDNIPFIKRLAARGRDYMERIIDLGPYDNGRENLLKAMLIGKREGIDENLKQNFINTGTVHIMAISGLHLVIVMAIILFICKITFIPGRYASLLCITFLILYAFLTGGRASIWRAAIMAGLYLGGRLFNRQADKWTTLSLAGLIILSISPQALFDSGFQLTFMAVFGLMYLYPRLENVLREKWKRIFDISASGYFVKALLVILTAQIALGPFLIYYYYRFPLITFIANLAIVPILGVVTILGFVASISGWVSLSVAMAFNAVNNIFLLIMDRTTAFLGNLPGQIIYLPRPHPLFFVFYYTILFLVFYPFKERSS